MIKGNLSWRSVEVFFAGEPINGVESISVIPMKYEYEDQESAIEINGIQVNFETFQWLADLGKIFRYINEPMDHLHIDVRDLHPATMELLDAE